LGTQYVKLRQWGMLKAGTLLQKAEPLFPKVQVEAESKAVD